MINFSLGLNSLYLSIFEGLKAFMTWFNSAKQLHLHLCSAVYKFTSNQLPLFSS